MAVLDPFDPESVHRYRQTWNERQFVLRKVIEGVKPFRIDTPPRVARRIDSMRAIVRSSPSSVNRDEAVSDDRVLEVLERLINQNDLLSTRFFLMGANVARSVCRIRLGDRGIGTGFLVTPTLLLTNHHVIRDRDDAAAMNAEFDFELDIDGDLKATVAFDFDPNGCFLTSDRRLLDYTLISVKPQSRKGDVPLSRFGFLRLTSSTGKILRGESMNVVQHPRGEPKQVALQNSHLTALLPNHLHYEADTMPGSSGSPVFNNQWVVVGLHHSGVPQTNENGEPLDRNGNVWDGENDDDIHWIGNEGIRISRVIADIRSKAKSQGQEQFLADFPIAPTNPTPDEEFQPGPIDSPSPTLPLASAPMSTPSTSTSPTGSVTVTIPLNITVSLGGAAVAGVTVAPAVTTTPATTHAVPKSDPTNIDELARLGRKLFQEAQTRTYYDEPRDTAEIERYYTGISPDANGFKSKLTSLIKETHTSPRNYDSARVQFLYAWVDLRRNKKVRSIYSTTEYDPSRFIDDDLVIERRRLERLEQFRSQEMFAESQLESFMDALEASDPFNAEHVVPQSWFKKKEPGRGDLHHLFACESNCNSFRSNHAYTDFGKFDIRDEAITRPRCGFQDDNQFEPFRGKAKVARATLYFALRYPGQFNKTGQAYDNTKIKMLVEWNEAIRPDEHEKHRNQAIQDIQGNRNPFIDHPEWARVFFLS